MNGIATHDGGDDGFAFDPAVGMVYERGAMQQQQQ